MLGIWNFVSFFQHTYNFIFVLTQYKKLPNDTCNIFYEIHICKFFHLHSLSQGCPFPRLRTSTGLWPTIYWGCANKQSPISVCTVSRQHVKPYPPGRR